MPQCRPVSYFFITNFTRLSDSRESEEFEQVLLSQLGTGRVRTPTELAEGGLAIKM